MYILYIYNNFIPSSNSGNIIRVYGYDSLHFRGNTSRHQGARHFKYILQVKNIAKQEHLGKTDDSDICVETTYPVPERLMIIGFQDLLDLYKGCEPIGPSPGAERRNGPCPGGGLEMTGMVEVWGVFTIDLWGYPWRFMVSSPSTMGII